MNTVRRSVARSRFARLAAIPWRAREVGRHDWQQVSRSLTWLVRSREFTNFTYALTPQNTVEMAWFVSTVTGLGFDQASLYIEELHDDQALLDHLSAAVAESPQRHLMDAEPRYGRRAAWYAITRATRPQRIIETGVDKGLGSCVFAAALLRNADEGHPGRLTAIDVNPNAGALIGGEYQSVIDLVFGDSIAILQEFSSPVDLFIHDSDHSCEHASAEYVAVAGALTERSLVMSDHDGPALTDFARASGRRLLVFREDPAEHWAPGEVLGVATYRWPELEPEPVGPQGWRHDG